ncbi:MAG: nitroreductase family protein [Eubacteriales bacterium]|nr:nitroreductase family protein [Eubacteriales bacterium]
MSLLRTIKKRRSIRRYTEEAISEKDLKNVLLAGLLAPTSQNRRPCEFYLIRDREVLKQLSKAKKAGAGMLADCNAAIAVFGDSSKADTWIEDCSIALSYMNLEAAALGLGSCWVQMHLRNSASGASAEETVRKILQIEQDSMRIVGILALGEPAEEMKAYTEEDADWGKVHSI